MISPALDLPRTNRRLVIAAFLALFGILAAQALLETARDALFLTHLPIGRLPWMYLTMAALTVVFTRVSRASVGTSLARGWRRRGRALALPLSLAIGAVVTAALALALARSRVAAVYAVFLWSGMFSAYTVTQIWTALGERVDLLAAKRIYGRLAAGGGLGAVAGAAVARALSHRVEPRQLVWLAAAIVAITALGPGWAMRGRADVQPPADAPHGNRPRRQATQLVERPFVRRLLLTALLAAAVSTLIDFSFKEAVAARLPAERLPAFFATFYLVTSALGLAVQLFGVGWLVRVAGVRRVPVLLPVLLLAGVVTAVLTGGLGAILLLRGLESALRGAVQRPAMELLQVPLGQRIRRRAKPIIDAVGQRSGQALAGLSLLGLYHVAATPGLRMVLAGLLLLVWSVVALDVARRYIDLLRMAAHASRGLARDRVLPAPATMRATLPDTQAELDPEGATRVLLDRLLIEEDEPARDRILRALDRIRRARPEIALDEDVLGRAAVAAVDSAYRYLAWRLFLDDGAARAPGRRTPTWELIQHRLRREEDHAIDRLFRVLALRYPREDFRHLLRTLRAGRPRARAAGRELIDNLLIGTAHTLTLALVEEVGDHERLAALAGGAPPRAPLYRDLLAEIRGQKVGTLAALAARHTAELAGPEIA